MSLHLLCLLGLLLPSGGDGLPLSEEGDGALAVEVADAPETVLAASE